MWTYLSKKYRGEMTTIIQKNQNFLFILVKDKLTRRGVLFIRIDNKKISSYVKASQQYNYSHLPPVIDTCPISRMFLQSITIDILDSICFNSYINSNRLKRYDVQINKVTDVSKAATSLIDNLSILSSKCPLLESLSIEPSDIKTMLSI